MAEGGSSTRWQYTLADIAEASGVSIHTVRDHKQQDLLHPDSLADVARYIAGWRAIKAAQREKDGIASGDVDETWGKPT